MSAKILDGRKLSEKLLSKLKQEVSAMNKRPVLAIVLVGDDALSLSYINRKKKTGEEIGVDVKIYKYPVYISQDELKREISKLNKDKNVTGIITQLPLPARLSTEEILNIIEPKKDVDVLASQSTNKLKILPPTVGGILRLLREYKIEIKNKNVAVVGYGRLVGQPASAVFKNLGAKISVVEINTPNKKEVTKNADIIISGVGKPNTITKDMIKPGAVVVDAGIAIKSGKLRGDAAEDVKEVAGYITPVPGGVGPMTVAMLFWNLTQLSLQ